MAISWRQRENPHCPSMFSSTCESARLLLARRGWRIPVARPCRPWKDQTGEKRNVRVRPVAWRTPAADTAARQCENITPGADNHKVYYGRGVIKAVAPLIFACNELRQRTPTFAPCVSR